jgi:hypothetical protein
VDIFIRRIDKAFSNVAVDVSKGLSMKMGAQFQPILNTVQIGDLK